VAQFQPQNSPARRIFQDEIFIEVKQFKNSSTIVYRSLIIPKRLDGANHLTARVEFRKVVLPLRVCRRAEILSGTPVPQNG
jgi:hypothetical protein